MMTATSFKARVTGPYVVAFVCERLSVDGATVPTFTRQHARTLDDPHELQDSCAAAASEHAITGTMVQAGSVHLGASSMSAAGPGWKFTLAAANGSYDLIATTADRIAVRRVR